MCDGQLRFLYCNARSLNNKLEHLSALAELYDPDIIGISETWLQEHISNAEIDLRGYEVFRNDRQNGRKGGGVMLYVKSDLQAMEFWPKTQFPEQTWCVIKDKCNKEYYVGIIYRSPNDDIHGSQVAGVLRDLLSEVHSKNLVLMGDFNYGNIDWNTLQPGHSATADTVLFLDCIEINCLTQHVKEPTRGTSILDLLITKDPDIVHEVQLLDTLAASDHRMITWTVDINRPTRRHRNEFDYNKGDYEAIRQRLNGINWSICLVILRNGGKRSGILSTSSRRHISLLSRPNVQRKRHCGLTIKQ